MKKSQQVALVAAGKLSESPLAGVRRLSARLGAVKAPSLRLASRLANSLRGGRPVSKYEDLEGYALILVSVPDAMAPGIVSAMALAKMSWAGAAVVLCSNDMGAGCLEALAQRGASTGSLGLIPGFGPRWFLAEADKSVEKQLRELVADPAVRLTAIEAGRKPLYLEALADIGSTLAPSLQRAAHLLREAAIPNVEAAAILEQQVSRIVQRHFRSGKGKSKGGSQKPPPVVLKRT